MGWQVGDWEPNLRGPFSCVSSGTPNYDFKEKFECQVLFVASSPSLPAAGSC